MTTKTKQIMEEEIENLSYDGRIMKGGIGVLTEQQEQAVRQSIIRILETAMEEVVVEVPKSLETDPLHQSVLHGWWRAHQKQMNRIKSILNSIKE